jgi:hypothetical protein
MRPMGRKYPDNDVIPHAPKVSNRRNTNAIKGLAVVEMRKIFQSSFSQKAFYEIRPID